MPERQRARQQQYRLAPRRRQSLQVRRRVQGVCPPRHLAPRPRWWRQSGSHSPLSTGDHVVFVILHSLLRACPPSPFAPPDCGRDTRSAQECRLSHSGLVPAQRAGSRPAVESLAAQLGRFLSRLAWRIGAMPHPCPDSSLLIRSGKNDRLWRPNSVWYKSIVRSSLRNPVAISHAPRTSGPCPRPSFGQS